MPFGKHKDKALANVPADYLLYMYDQLRPTDPLKKYITDNLDVLKAESSRFLKR